MNLLPDPKTDALTASSSFSSSASPQSSDDKRLIEAIALWLVTDKYSPNSMRAHARLRRDDILRNAKRIEEREAARLLNSRALEAEYRRLAAYAAPKTDFTAAQLILMLGRADEWPYILLLVAKNWNLEKTR